MNAAWDYENLSWVAIAIGCAAFAAAIFRDHRRSRRCRAFDRAVSGRNGRRVR